MPRRAHVLRRVVEPAFGAVVGGDALARGRGVQRGTPSRRKHARAAAEPTVRLRPASLRRRPGAETVTETGRRPTSCCESPVIFAAVARFPTRRRPASQTPCPLPAVRVGPGAMPEVPASSSCCRARRGAPQARVRKDRGGGKPNKARDSAPVADRNDSSEERRADGSDDADDSDSDDEGTEGYRKRGYHPVKIGEAFKDGRHVVKRTWAGAILHLLVVATWRPADCRARWCRSRRRTTARRAGRDRDPQARRGRHDGRPGDEPAAKGAAARHRRGQGRPRPGRGPVPSTPVVALASASASAAEPLVIGTDDGIPNGAHPARTRW